MHNFTKQKANNSGACESKRSHNAYYTYFTTPIMSGSELKRDSVDKKQLLMLTSQNGKIMFIMALLALLIVYRTEGKIIAQK